jgi:hypothetical protein
MAKYGRITIKKALGLKQKRQFILKSQNAQLQNGLTNKIKNITPKN